MRKLIVILFIALIASVWATSSLIEVSPGTEFYTKEMWHQKMCIQPRYKNLPECQKKPTETAIDVSGIIVQM
jgi:hypothetical protein